MSDVTPIPAGTSFAKGTFGGKKYDWDALLTEQGGVCEYYGKLSSFKAGAIKQALARGIDPKRLMYAKIGSQNSSPDKNSVTGKVAVKLAPKANSPHKGR